MLALAELQRLVGVASRDTLTDKGLGGCLGMEYTEPHRLWRGLEGEEVVKGAGP